MKEAIAKYGTKWVVPIKKNSELVLLREFLNNDSILKGLDKYLSKHVTYNCHICFEQNNACGWSVDDSYWSADYTYVGSGYKLIQLNDLLSPLTIEINKIRKEIGI